MVCISGHFRWFWCMHLIQSLARLSIDHRIFLQVHIHQHHTLSRVFILTWLPNSSSFSPWERHNTFFHFLRSFRYIIQIQADMSSKLSIGGQQHGIAVYQYCSTPGISFTFSHVRFYLDATLIFITDTGTFTDRPSHSLQTRRVHSRRQYTSHTPHALHLNRLCTPAAFLVSCSRLHDQIITSSDHVPLKTF